MATFAELALDSAPKRVTEAHVAALVEADMAKKRIDAERAIRAQKRRERIERERARQVAASKGELAKASLGIAAVRRAMKGQG